MESDDTKKEQKRLYEKPKLRTIELAAEEVLAVGCKIDGSALPGVFTLTSCGISSTCVSDGS